MMVEQRKISSIRFSPKPLCRLVLGSWSPNSVECGYHFVKWALSEIRYLLVIASPLHQYILQPRQHSRSKVLHLYFFFTILQIILLYQFGLKFLCMHQLKFATFNEFCRCCLDLWKLTISILKRNNQSPENGFICSGFSMGSFRLTTLLDLARSGYKKFTLVTKVGHQGL